MKKFLLSTVAIAMLTTAASAADLDAAPEPIMDNWAGWYVGVNGGYGFANDPGVLWLRDGGLIDGPSAPSAQPLLADQAIVQELNGFGLKRGQGNSSWNPEASGFFGGVQVGYNWQDDIYVYGLEGDFQFSDINGKDGYYDFYDGSNCGGQICILGGHEQLDRVSQKLKWFSTVRGRAGVSPNESLLFYATAGLAFGQVKNKAYGYYETFGGYGGPFPYESSYSASSSKTKVGWTAGFGSELKITENVSFKVEYLYLDLGKQTISSELEESGGILVCRECDISPVTYKHKFKNQFHTVKAGVNFMF